LTRGNFFIKYANVIPVKGASNYILCDLQKCNFWTIDEFAYKLFTKYINKPVKEILQENKKDSKKILEYFSFFESKELAFFSNNPEYFPDLNLEWDEPYEITNLIIDYNKSSGFVKQLTKALSNMVVFSTQIRVFEILTCEDLFVLLDVISNQPTRSFELILPYSNSFTMPFLKKITLDYDRLVLINFFNAPSLDKMHFREDSFGRIFFSTSSIYSEKNCGINHKSLFVVNYKMFTESTEFNSCLNRKISIDQDGEIKNCPSMKQSFGNIKTKTLMEAMLHPDFKKMWTVNKDKIDVCKDCEFRYICTDCRAYLDDPKDIYSKPLKCGYNPYSGEWSEWSTNPLKQKSINHYELQDII